MIFTTESRVRSDGSTLRFFGFSACAWAVPAIAETSRASMPTSRAAHLEEIINRSYRSRTPGPPGVHEPWLPAIQPAFSINETDNPDFRR